MDEDKSTIEKLRAETSGAIYSPEFISRYGNTLQQVANELGFLIGNDEIALDQYINALCFIVVTASDRLEKIQRARSH